MILFSLSETDENPFENISERATWGEDEHEDENLDTDEGNKLRENES